MKHNALEHDARIGVTFDGTDYGDDGRSQRFKIRPVKSGGER